HNLAKSCIIWRLLNSEDVKNVKCPHRDSNLDLSNMCVLSLHYESILE
ncbi:hypothetical protein X975_00124, partial [Stegodyphus mimosarum]